ncbi:hypothetical protein GCM10010280_65050 [Streptomyces pilosus]|uniref:Uncharacterized protein n=1 Tax=Streptomyces pilosus TaxID=28893 RepID=A0A918F7B9_9ACTN|nr:hypothetical protein GCM10010280_65050 [Streptomyces pilosus]
MYGQQCERAAASSGGSGLAADRRLRTGRQARSLPVPPGSGSAAGHAHAESRLTLGRGAFTYTDKINALLVGFRASQVLTEVARHKRITAAVNISVSDYKDKDPAIRPALEAREEEQKTRFVKMQGVVVDYIGLAEEVQRAVTDPTAEKAGGRGRIRHRRDRAGRRVPHRLRPHRRCRTCAAQRDRWNCQPPLVHCSCSVPERGCGRDCDAAPHTDNGNQARPHRR